MHHKHLMVRAEVEKPITKEVEAKEWLYQLTKTIGMNICPNGGPYAHYVEKPNNYGIAAVVMIETSHISLHVWDRDDPPLVQFDVYSCSDYEVRDVLKAIDQMQPMKIWYKLFDRGKCIQEKDNSYQDLTKKEGEIWIDDCLWWL